MKRCTAICPSNLRAAGQGCQPRRWASYDRAALTKESLLQEVEAGLGHDVDGKPLKVDVDSKTVSTAAGDLAISPIFDPEWMKARRQQTKADRAPPQGRFRRKLANNLYARALATPIRRCPNTLASLPRFFLQDFELVQHPTTGAPWWAPGSLSVRSVQPIQRPDKPTETNDDAGDEAGESDLSPSDSDSETVSTATTTSSTTTTPETASNDNQPPRPRRGPITGYTLCRKSIVDILGGPNKRYTALLLAVRSGMAMAPDTRNAVWRQDMGDVLLSMMRRHVVDGLITRANRPEATRFRFIQPCADWGAVKDAKRPGCVLWLPEKRDAVGQYDTFDIEGVQYGRKLAVHNLPWLLGEEEVERLRSEAEVFRENRLLVLTQWKSHSMTGLHMLLWRLQGYLAEPQ